MSRWSIKKLNFVFLKQLQLICKQKKINEKPVLSYEWERKREKENLIN